MTLYLYDSFCTLFPVLHFVLPRCVLNATADGIEVATDAMDGFLASVTGGIDSLPSYVVAIKFSGHNFGFSKNCYARINYACEYVATIHTYFEY